VLVVTIISVVTIGISLDAVIIIILMLRKDDPPLRATRPNNRTFPYTIWELLFVIGLSHILSHSLWLLFIYVFHVTWFSLSSSHFPTTGALFPYPKFSPTPHFLSFLLSTFFTAGAWWNLNLLFFFATPPQSFRRTKRLWQSFKINTSNYVSQHSTGSWIAFGNVPGGFLLLFLYVLVACSRRQDALTSKCHWKCLSIKREFVTQR